MIYLVISKQGYFLALSKVAAEEKCKVLKVSCDAVIDCTCFEDAERCIKAYKQDINVASIQCGVVMFWERLYSVCMINIRKGESHIYRSDGQVTWKRKNVGEVTYKICQNKVLDDKKTVNLLKKYGVLNFYDFETDTQLLLLKDGTIQEKQVLEKKEKSVRT